MVCKGISVDVIECSVVVFKVAPVPITALTVDIESLTIFCSKVAIQLTVL